jgi:hypothetical protein
VISESKFYVRRWNVNADDLIRETTQKDKLKYQFQMDDLFVPQGKKGLETRDER